jgi:hypothetical protein
MDVSFLAGIKNALLISWLSMFNMVTNNPIHEANGMKKKIIKISRPLSALAPL